jgi:c(7)-type cytochrome triheme protein
MTGVDALRRLALAVLLAAPTASPAMSFEPPQRYGRVELSHRAFAAKVPPVFFDHWRHRARFTCRLCHVDVGFAMSAGQTEISASTNRSGYHCGACHNGKTVVGGTPVFASCSAGRNVDEAPRCRRCHAEPDPARLLKEYDAFAAKLPKTGVARGVDWEEAESKGHIRPLDFLEGVSIRRAPLKMDKEIVIASSGWMTDVLFSHRKHSVWNGCEVCHPEIYPSTKSGTKKTSMIQISAGDSCGVCHTKVAFQIAECQRCHVNPVK